MPLVSATRARGRPPKGHRGPWRSTPTTPSALPLAAMGMDETPSIGESLRAAGWDSPEPAVEEATARFEVWMNRVSQFPTAADRAPRVDPRRGADSDRETWTLTMTWDWAQGPAHPASGMDRREEDPRMDGPPGGRPGRGPPSGLPGRGRPKAPSGEGPPGGPLGGDPQPDRRERTSRRAPSGGLFTPRGRSGTWSARCRSTRLRVTSV